MVNVVQSFVHHAITMMKTILCMATLFVVAHALTNPYLKEYSRDYEICHERLPHQMMYGECVPNGCWEELPRKMTSGEGLISLFVKYPDGTYCLGGPGRCFNGTCIRPHLFRMFSASPDHEVHREELFPLADRVNTTLPYCGNLNNAVVPSKVICSRVHFSTYKYDWIVDSLCCMDVEEGGVCQGEDDDDDVFCQCNTIDAMECMGRPPAVATRFSPTRHDLELLERECYGPKKVTKDWPHYFEDDDEIPLFECCGASPP